MPAYRAHPPAPGFTLIELLVSLAVIALLTSLVAPNYLHRVEQARESVLRHDLAGLRTAIDQFYRDRGRYPAGLGELVELRYIREIPIDPLTDRRDTWVEVSPQSAGGSPVAGGVFDVRSGAPGAARDGTPYASW